MFVFQDLLLPDLSPGSFKILFSLLLRALAAWYDTFIPKYFIK